MFCYCGNFNNPFMMNNLFMSNMFMPAYSFNMFMPDLFNMFATTPQITNYSSPFMYLGTQPYAFQNTNTSLFNLNNSLIGDKPSSSVRTPRLSGVVENREQTRAQKRSTKSGKELGPEFLNRVKQIAKKLNCNYKDLLGVMNAESGLDSKAVNPNGGATGLIQFMPATAKELGTTTEKLKNMPPLKQLDFVEKYLLKNKKTAGFKQGEKLGSGDLYALVFLPGRAKRTTLTTSNEKYYKYNKGLDLNKDGKITKNELAQRVQRKYVNDSIFA